MDEEVAFAEQGVIAKLRRNFGFIACPHRVGDIFFHQTSLEDCSLEQLTEGTAVTFIEDNVEGGKPLAKRVRLAPVGTRVRLTQLEPGVCFGHISDPASGNSKGVVRFINADGAPEHLLYDAADVQHPVQPSTSNNHPPLESPTLALPPDPQPALAAALAPEVGPNAAPPPAGLAAAAQPPSLLGTSPGPPASTPDPQQQPRGQQYQQCHQPMLARRPPGRLERGQVIFFHICTDMRAAQLARQAAARGGPPARRIAYQRAVELRPVAAGELASWPQLQRQSDLLELLEAAVQASKAAKSQGVSPQQLQ